MGDVLDENCTEKVDDEIIISENKNEDGESNKNIEEESGKIEESTENKEVDYDSEDDDSVDDFAVITKTSNENSSPNKNMFSIKTVSNIPSHNSYKLSRTAVDLNHPGNINGVATIEYDLSKVIDEYKPWKKPGADITDYFNYGFTEETWLGYCEKQKNLRIAQDNSAMKTLSGFTNIGYPLSGSHIHLGGNKSQGTDKNKHNEMGMGGKISTIPVQTGLNMGQNHSNNLVSNLTNSTALGTAAAPNPLNSFMSAAMAMGLFSPAVLGGAAAAVAANAQHPGAPASTASGVGSTGSGSQQMNVDSGSGNQFWGGMPNTNVPPNQHQMGGGGGYERRSNSYDSMHSNEEYGDRKNFSKSERSNRRTDRDDYSVGGNRRHRSRERREKSSERRRRSRSRDRERDYESRHSKKRIDRSPANIEDGNRFKHRDRRSRSRGHRSGGGGSSRRHHHHHHHRHGSRSKSRTAERREKRRHRRSISKNTAGDANGNNGNCGDVQLSMDMNGSGAASTSLSDPLLNKIKRENL